MIYAAHDDVAIYALGSTPDEAIGNARRDAKDPDAQFQAHPIADDFAVLVERDGFDGKRDSFDVRDGIVVPTDD